MPPLATLRQEGYSDPGRRGVEEVGGCTYGSALAFCMGGTKRRPLIWGAPPYDPPSYVPVWRGRCSSDQSRPGVGCCRCHGGAEASALDSDRVGTTKATG